MLCREIARRLAPDATLIGWRGCDPHVEFPKDGEVYVLGMAVDMVFGKPFAEIPLKRVVWIDYHPVYIDSHPKDLAGYRIEGVSASCLAWQWFSKTTPLPTREQYLNFTVQQPLVLRLAHEYKFYETPFPA